VENGDTIIVDVNRDLLECVELRDEAVRTQRERAWHDAVAGNGGIHPSVRPVTHRVLKRMRATATSALDGGGMVDF